MHTPKPGVIEAWTACRLQIGDTADYKSALRNRRCFLTLCVPLRVRRHSHRLDGEHAVCAAKSYHQRGRHGDLALRCRFSRHRVRRKWRGEWRVELEFTISANHAPGKHVLCYMQHSRQLSVLLHTSLDSATEHGGLNHRSVRQYAAFCLDH